MKNDVLYMAAPKRKHSRSHSTNVTHRGKSYVHVVGNTSVPAGTAARTRLRASSSRTVTKRTKKKTPVAGPMPCVGGNGSWSSVYYSHKASKLGRLLKLLPQPYYITTNGSGSIGASIGQQGSAMPLQLFNFADLSSMVSDYANQHPILPAKAGITTSSQRFLLQECHAKLMLSNAGGDTMFYTIYDIMARKDIDNNTSNASPLYAWAQGNTNEAFNNSTGTSVNYVGASVSQICTTPMQSFPFRQNFRIMKKTVGQLGPSAIHTHSVTLKPNKIFNGELLNNTVGSAITMANLSYFCLVVAFGAPVTDDTNVSTGSGKICYVGTRNYIFKGIESSTETIYNANGIVNTLTTEKLVAEGTSASIINFLT